MLHRLGSIFPLLLATSSCLGQQDKLQEVHTAEFQWTMALPQRFERVEGDEWDAMKARGRQAIEDTYDTEVEDGTTTLFVFRSDEMNYFEAVHQPFDTLVDGPYSTSCKEVNEILYGTMLAQLPGIAIDSLSTLETIDDLVFQKFAMTIHYPNDMTLNVLMYSRLFGNKELAVNIMAVDEDKREAMLKAWLGSRFRKS